MNRRHLRTLATAMECEPKMVSGSSASDPISVLDDDEPDATEISYIDLENDSEALTDEKCTVPIKPAMTVTGSHSSGSQKIAKIHSPYNTPEGSDSVRHTKRVTFPLFRTLTKDELPAPSVQTVAEDRGIGFKAWYRANDPLHTANASPGTQQNAISQNLPIGIFNEERTRNTTRRDRDAPQFEMNVLRSNCKRTIGELGYDELISPVQIESPSEKLARMAKKRRQRQERCDLSLLNANAGDAQSAENIDHACGNTFDRTIGENLELAASPIECESRNLQENVLGVGDEHTGPSVLGEPFPYVSTEDHPDHSDGRMNAYGIHSSQTTAQDRDAQKQSNGPNAAYSSDSASRDSRDQKPRVAGPTRACGVLSPEKKPPVKRSHNGAFHCPRCDSQFTRSRTVNYHFEGCVAKYGNPESLRWNDHPSHEGVKKHAIRDNELRPTIKDDAWSSWPEPKLDRPVPPVEHRATAGGKGLSKETLKRFQETGSWNGGIEVDQSALEAEIDENEVPDIAYHYFVQKREWLETEEDAIESSIGPFHTMNEANAVAKAEVQSPQIDGYEGIQARGWSYYYEQNENGMQTHMATILEIHIETAVNRGKCHLLGLVTRNRKLIRIYQHWRQPIRGFPSPNPHLS